VPVIITEMMIEDKIRCRQAEPTNHEKTEGSNGFFFSDGGPSGSTWVDTGAYRALDISRMKPGLGRIVDCRVYRSSVECKDTCSSVGLRTGEVGGDGDGDKGPKVGYISPQAM